MVYPQNSKLPMLHVRGFSLIELMIGLAIGFIGLLAVIQVLSVWSGRVQTTTSGNDAQISGALGAYFLERDIKHAGLGFGSAPPSILGCTVKGDDPIATIFRLAPVEISSGAVGTPQKISVLQGDSEYFVTGHSFQSSTVNTKVTSKGYGFQPGHFVVIGRLSTALCSSGAPQTLALGKIVTSVVVAPNVTLTTSKDTDALVGSPFSAGMLYDLGAGAQRNLWEIDATTPGRPILRWSNTLQNATNFFEAAEGIVNLQAHYGYDTNNDNIIQETEWTSTLPNTADWTKVRGIRLALLARSKQFEPVQVTTTAPAPSWAANAASCGATVLGCSFLMTDIGGNTDTDTASSRNNWRHYRYRVYEKVIPLPNMIYGTQL